MGGGPCSPKKIKKKKIWEGRLAPPQKIEKNLEGRLRHPKKLKKKKIRGGDTYTPKKLKIYLGGETYTPKKNFVVQMVRCLFEKNRFYNKKKE